MSEQERISELRLALKRFAWLSQLARHILHGPRAVMFPDDPKGKRSWLEPVIWLKAHLLPAKTSKSLIVFTVPNCLERTPESPVLVRYCKWESGIDKNRSQKETNIYPSIKIIYRSLAADEIEHVDSLCLKVDESLASFPFPLEGLGLSGPSDFKPLPSDAVIITNTTHQELCRTSRFSYIEYRWTPIEDRHSNLDRAWLQLFKAMIGFAEKSNAMGEVETIEKYDIEPSKLEELLTADRA